MPSFRTRRPLAPACALASVLALAACAAMAQPMDSLYGSSNRAVAKSARKGATWQIGDYSWVQLTDKERGAPDNQHPAKVTAELLRSALASVQTQVEGKLQPLFGSSELGDLVSPLTEAFATAKPGDDVVLVSSARREGFQLTPRAVTARLFFANGALNLIVHDARYDFFNKARGSNTPPDFTFGSRTQPGADPLVSSIGSNRRPDWLVLNLTAPIPATPALVLPGGVAPAPAPAPAPAAPGAAVPTPAPVAAPPATAAPVPHDKAYYDQIEMRLETLKRLRDRNLISEDEYQKKRREILDAF